MKIHSSFVLLVQMNAVGPLCKNLNCLVPFGKTYFVEEIYHFWYLLYTFFSYFFVVVKMEFWYIIFQVYIVFLNASYYAILCDEISCMLAPRKWCGDTVNDHKH